MTRALLSFVGLFTAVGTLFCCALPALFVLLGAGAAFAGLTRTVPQLIWVAENKDWFFAIGGISLVLSVVLPRLSPSVEACAVDEDNESTACETTRDWTVPLFRIACVAYAIGVAFAYIFPLFM